ncbi:hypothetical protein HOY80DRAFT_956114 [Tuber brumale]|nr:hypothetical protein HOY80DRAFT_956114 [Tuber brumale]
MFVGPHLGFPPLSLLSFFLLSESFHHLHSMQSTLGSQPYIFPFSLCSCDSVQHSPDQKARYLGTGPTVRCSVGIPSGPRSFPV